MKVVSLSPLWREDLAALLRDGISLISVDPADAGRVATELPGAAVVLTTRFDRTLAALCGSLELIVCPAAGTEYIDRSSVPIGVGIVTGAGHEIPIAEYVIGALVALRQRFIEADAALRRGCWLFGYAGGGAFVGELRGSTMGLIGYGRVGIETAKLAKAFGIACRALTLHPEKRFDADLLPLGLGDIKDPQCVDRLVREFDAIVVACELSPLTRALLDARRFGLMRADAVLVNVARGGIVDERAMYDALREKRICGAAIDVWYRYPDSEADALTPSDLPFEELDNVLMTPHCSGWTLPARRRRLEQMAGRINEWYESRRLAP